MKTTVRKSIRSLIVSVIKTAAVTLFIVPVLYSCKCITSFGYGHQLIVRWEVEPPVLDCYMCFYYNDMFVKYYETPIYVDGILSLATLYNPTYADRGYFMSDRLNCNASKDASVYTLAHSIVINESTLIKARTLFWDSLDSVCLTNADNSRIYKMWRKTDTPSVLETHFFNPYSWIVKRDTLEVTFATQTRLRYIFTVDESLIKDTD